MCTIIIVMSSVRVSYCNHSRYDSATIAAHASFGSSYFATCWANKITNWHLAHSAVVASQPLAFLLRHNQLRLLGLHVVRQRQTTGETTCRRILSCNFRTKRWNAYHSTFKNVQNEHTIRASRFPNFRLPTLSSLTLLAYTHIPGALSIYTPDVLFKTNAYVRISNTKQLWV